VGKLPLQRLSVKSQRSESAAAVRIGAADVETAVFGNMKSLKSVDFEELQSLKIAFFKELDTLGLSDEGGVIP